ncbi:MAG: HYR domain-containing protein, partial [Nitrosotalea sp.]
MALVLSSMFVGYSWATPSPSFSTQWGTYGLQNTGQFAFPQGVSIDSSGNVYVTDLGNRRVEKFDNNGNFLFTFGTKGGGDGQFNAPVGIAITSDSIYVVDNARNDIQKFDSTGKFVTKWGGQGSSTSQFLLPQGVAVDPSGDVYVVDTGNSRVEKFDSTGKFLLTIGQSGLGDGQFLSPRAVAADSQGSIFVADSGGNKIEKFTQDGVFLKSFDASTGANLQTPLGMSIDNSGNIFVADSGSNRIVELDTNGHPVTSWGSQGTGANFFDNPRATAVDSTGNVFVVDSNNNRIQKFVSASPSVITSPTQTTNQTATNPTQKVIVTQNTTQANTPKITAPNDHTPPSITAPADMTVEATGILTPVSIGQATGTDDSGIASITSNAPPKFPLGITMITWTAIDNGGNMAKAVQKITVVDTTSPVLTAPQPVTIEAKSPDHNSVDIGLPSVNDAVGVESVTNDAPPYFSIGKTTVTWKAIDTSGNAATATQVVTVQDTTQPVIHAPADITQEATSSTSNVVALGNATVTDNGIIKSVTNNAPAVFPLGKTTVTWTATDQSDNHATATQVVNIVDTTAPKVSPPSAVTFEATSLNQNVVALGNATVTDNGIIKSITNNATQFFALGKTTILWVATDVSGNKANATQTVNVVHTIPPKLTVPANITFEATSLKDNSVPIGNATATDIQQVTITNNASKTFPLGKTAILWIAKDLSGNTSNGTQIISVVDTTAPKITAPASITVEATSLNNNTVQLNNPSVTDLQPITITNNAPKEFQLGSTTITWNVVDASGNKANATQTVTVKDTTAPKITAPADISVKATSLADNTVPLVNATTSDNVSVVSLTNNAPKTFPLGKTSILWIATDEAGNKANATQIVDVENTTPPKLTIPANITFEATSLNNNTIPLGNATASDIEPVTITNNAPKTFPLGKTTILWVATDVSGNKANATQTVNVVHTIPPKLTVPANITFEATSLKDNSVPIGNATATDIQQVTITNNASKTFPLGKTAILWIAKDASGNTSNGTQTVDVVHTIPPRLTVPAGITFEATSIGNNTISLGAPTVVDIDQVTVTNDAPKQFPIGLTTITWTAKDASGNTSNATQTVLVQNTTPPQLTVPANITFEATSLKDNSVPIGNATATDIQQVTITNNASKTFPLGKTAILWIAKDASGNTSNGTQTISVVDTTAPKITAPSTVTVVAGSISDNIVPIGNANATDDVKLVSLTNNAPKTFPLGKTSILWIATDEAGNKANATQIVDVENTTPPKLTIPANITFEATSLNNNTIPLGNATASDIEPVTITNNAPKTFPLGKTIILWVATDVSGNKANATQTVNVVHTIAPKLAVPANVTFEATSLNNNTISLVQPTTTDIESVTITNNAPAAFSLGKTAVLWTVTDASGNKANATQIVDVKNTTPPQLTVPANITFEATSLKDNSVPIGNATATDIQ